MPRSLSQILSLSKGFGFLVDATAGRVGDQRQPLQSMNQKYLAAASVVDEVEGLPRGCFIGTCKRAPTAFEILGFEFAEH